MKKHTETTIQAPVKTELSYTEIGRTVDEDGWPMVRCLRSDGKKVKLPAKRFTELRKQGRVLASPVKEAGSEGVGRGKDPQDPVSEPLPQTPQVAEKYRNAVTPPEFFAIHTVGNNDRVQIIDKLDADWQELFCYHIQYRRTMHLRTKDLEPKPAVEAAITFLRKVTH